MVTSLWRHFLAHHVVAQCVCDGAQCLNKGFEGPAFGPKMSEEHKREFTEEQLRAGEGHIGLQAGYNKGATQSGINIGKPRSVHD